MRRSVFVCIAVVAAVLLAVNVEAVNPLKFARANAAAAASAAPLPVEAAGQPTEIVSALKQLLEQKKVSEQKRREERRGEEQWFNMHVHMLNRMYVCDVCLFSVATFSSSSLRPRHHSLIRICIGEWCCCACIVRGGCTAHTRC